MVSTVSTHRTSHETFSNKTPDTFTACLEPKKMKDCKTKFDDAERFIPYVGLQLHNGITVAAETTSNQSMKAAIYLVAYVNDRL